jgi:hypothetical protein
MVVTVFALQFFRSDVTVLQDMINHGLGAFPCDGLAQLKEFFWIF